MNTGEVRKPTVSLMASSAARTPKVAPARKESDEMKEKIRSLEGELTALKLEKSSQQTPPAGGAETAGPTLQAELDQAKLRASTLEAELKHAQDKLLELGQAAEAESNTVKELEANLRAGHTKEVEHLRVKHQSELSALSEESDSKDQQHQEALGALRAEFDDARNTSAETAKSSANAQKRLDEVINSHQREMQELNERQRTSDEAHKSAEKQVSHLTAELDGMGKVIDNLKDELQKQHQLSEKEHQEKSRQLISDHESSMKSVRDAHSKELSEVNDTHSRALAKQISTLKSERVEVEQTASKELTLANEKNQELEASLQAMKKGESELLAAEKQKSRGLETEITALQKSLEALEVEAKGREADRAGALSKLQEELVQSRKQLSEREKELASIREERPRELEHLKKSHAAEIEAAKARAQTQSTQLTDLKAGRELVQKNTQEQQSAHTAAMEAATKEHKSLLQKKLDEHQEAQRSHSNAQAEMQKTHEATVSSLKAEHSKLLSASKAEGQKLSILEAQLATERGTVAKLQSQLRESSKTHDSALAALKTQLAAHEISKKQQIAALEASQRQRSASKADREILQKAHDDHQTRAKKSATDLAAAQQQLQALTAEHAALKLKLQHPDPSEADALRSRLSACTTEHETATAALLAQHAAAAAAKEAEVKALKDGQKRAAAIEAQKFAAERQGLERERDVAENEVKKVRRALEVAKETANGDLKDLGTVFNERVAEIEAERGLREGEIKAEREKGVGEVEVLKRKVAELEAARQTAGMKKGIKGSKWAVAEDVPATSSSKTDAAAARHLNGSKAAGAADEEEEDQEWPAEKVSPTALSL